MGITSNNRVVTLRRRCAMVVVWVLLLCSQRAEASLPRIYLNSPVGANLASFEYRFTTGNATVDESLPIRDLKLDTNIFVGQYVRIVDIAGNHGLLSMLVPYADISGTATTPAGDAIAGSRSGVGDPTFIAVMSFMGAPALTAPEFRMYRQSTILAGSLSITAPLGEYKESKAINPGSNRWAIKPELVVSHAVKKWILELYANVYWFTDNDESFGGTKLEQDPLYGAEAHISYTFSPGVWASLDTTYFYGGEAFVDGVSLNNKQGDTQGGASFIMRAGKQSALRFTYNTKIVVKPGVPDMDLYTAAYIYRWGGK